MLSRGIVGDRGGVPKIASPMYKQSFDLRTGQCLDDPAVTIPRYDARVLEDGRGAGAPAGQLIAMSTLIRSSPVAAWSAARSCGWPTPRRRHPAARASAGGAADADGGRPLLARPCTSTTVSNCRRRRSTTRISIPLEPPAARAAVRLRGRSRRLHRLQGLRRRLPQPERPRRDGDVAHGGPAARRHQPGAGAADGHHRLPPLRRSGLPDRLPGAGLREGSGHRHRPPPRRPVHRLPVLHADVPVRRAQVQPASAASCASATCAATGWRAARRRPACRAAPTRRSASAWSTPVDVRARRRGRHFLPGAPDPRAHRPDDGLHAASGPRRANLLPADFYSVSPEHSHWPLVVMLVLTQLAVGAFAGVADRPAPAGPAGAGAAGAGAGGGGPGAGRAGAGGERVPPGPAAVRLAGVPGAAHLVDEPRGAGLRPASPSWARPTRCRWQRPVDCCRRSPGATCWPRWRRRWGSARAGARASPACSAR